MFSCLQPNTSSCSTILETRFLQTLPMKIFTYSENHLNQTHTSIDLPKINFHSATISSNHSAVARPKLSRSKNFKDCETFAFIKM